MLASKSLFFNFFLNSAAVSTAAFFLQAENPTITFTSGKVEYAELKNEVTFKTGLLDVNSTVSSNHILGTGKGSRVEFQNKKMIWRLGSSSTARLEKENSFFLINGSAIVCSLEETELYFKSISSTARFNGKGTIIIETTSNGGFKVIPLEVKATLTTDKGGTKKLSDGRLLLVLNEPTEFGDAYDLDLLLLLKSSRLINSFPDPLPTFDRIGLSIYEQQLKLKGKYNALIGDATSKDNLQIWKFGKKNTKK